MCAGITKKHSMTRTEELFPLSCMVSIFLLNAYIYKQVMLFHFHVTGFLMRSHCVLHHTCETDTGKTMRNFTQLKERDTKFKFLY